MIQYERTPQDNRQNKNEAKINHLAFGMDQPNYDDYYYVPGRICGFVKQNDKVMAFVKVLKENSCKRLSVLTVKWDSGLDSAILVDVNAFVGHCLIMPRDEIDTSTSFSKMNNGWMQILHPDLWADKFHLDVD